MQTRTSAAGRTYRYYQPLLLLPLLLLLTACGGSAGSEGVGEDAVSGPTNAPPTAEAAATGDGATSSTVTLDGLGSLDADGSIEAYSWTQVSGRPLVTMSGADTHTASFIVPELTVGATLEFQLTVTDDHGDSDSDVATVALQPATYTVVGSIQAARGSVADGDVNDPGAPATSNDSSSSPQYLANPSVVAGFVGLEGAVGLGALDGQGDASDFYRAKLLEGQPISLAIADADLGDVDLYLYSADLLGLIDASVGTGSTESLIVPEDGEYLIEVVAESGASSYTLVLNEAAMPGTASMSRRLSDDFVPGHIILERSTAVSSSSVDLRTTSLTVGSSSLDVGRPVLATLETDAVRSQAAAQDRTTSLVDPVMRRKYATLMALKELAADRSLVYAEPNFRIASRSVPNDPHYDVQWHYPMIALPAAWELTQGSPGVTAAVIDTGILSGHPDLTRRLRDGYDFITDPDNAADGDGPDADPEDPGDGEGSHGGSFHGTHVAGTIAALTDNGVGVAGVAPEATLMPLRVLGVDGGTSYDVLQAVRYASGLSNDSGRIVPAVQVINLSLGRSGSCTAAEQSTFDAARAAGVVIIAAAGNDSVDASDAWPASCHGVVAVGAVDQHGEIAPYSNYGSAVDVWAPGGDGSVDEDGDGWPDSVLSLKGRTIGGSMTYTYETSQGTSMAAPHVAGVVALMYAANSDLTPAQIDQLLLELSMTDADGLIDAYASVVAALDAAGIDVDAMLTVSPEALDFGSVYTYAEVETSVVGDGPIDVHDVTTSAQWLTVEALSVDEQRIGRYAVTVDRAALSEGEYAADISFATSSNTVEVPVVIQVEGSPEDANAGHLHVLLTDADTGAVVAAIEAGVVGGRYDYEFAAVPAGLYRVTAGSDVDNDGYICDAGETCGVFPNADVPGVLEVGGDVSGLDFPVGPTVTTTGSGEGSEAGLARH